MGARSTPDVLIVGAGVIGLAAAHALLRAGRSICVLDQGAPGSGASHGNCGTITPSHAPPLSAPGVVARALRWMFTADAPLYIPPRWDPALWAWLARFAARSGAATWLSSARAKAALLHDSRQRLQRLIEDAELDCGFEESGLLYVFRDERALDTQWAEHRSLDGLGIAAERWSVAQTLEAEPLLRPGTAGAIHFPGDACLRPDRYVAELARAVRELGGEIRSDAEVVELDPQHAAVRLRDGSRLEGGQLLIACGAWSPRFAKAMRVRVPIQPGKGYSLTYPRPSQAPRRPMVLRERSVCVTTWADGLRLGSTMEFSGYDASLNPTRLAALQRGAAGYLDLELDAARAEPWFGWRPMTYDDLPMIGALPGAPKAFLAAGHGMLGVSMSVGTAALLTALMTGAESAIDPRPYRPERFADRG